MFDVAVAMELDSFFYKQMSLCSRVGADVQIKEQKGLPPHRSFSPLSSPKFGAGSMKHK